MLIGTCRVNRFRRLLTFVLLLVSAQGTAQGVLSGTLVDAVTKEPVIGALVRVDGSFTATISDLHGGFRFSQLPAATIALSVTHLSYNDLHVTATVPKENLQLLLEPRTILSDEVTVTATRADNKSAMTYTSVTKEDLQSLNLGQDLPILLNYLPSVVTTSDAGAGVGYTGIRIRGSDATRVNVTINGVPVNDAESHQVYWVDLPDIASSVDNLQVQRGIGTSTNGAGAFGGSINIRSDATSPEAYGELNSSYGSFNTWKNTLRFGTGLLQGKFGLEGRLSRITSDGFIERASSDLRSYYLSGGYFGKNQSLRFVLFSGKEQTYQAWYGVPEDSLATNRQFNPAGLYLGQDGQARYYDNQTDNYQQDYYQAIYNRTLGKYWTLNGVLHYTKGRGYYEEYRPTDAYSNYGLPDLAIGDSVITATDLVRQRWLDNDFYGLTASANYLYDRWDLRLGGSLYRFEGLHFGELTWAQLLGNVPTPYRYYENSAEKNDRNMFLKAHYTLSPGLYLMGDLQFRTVDYTFEGPDRMGNRLPQTVNFNFFNPKAGITYEWNARHRVYFSFARGSKEPVRDDFVDSSPESRPNAERMTDFEVGYHFNARAVRLSVNAYLMDYTDQLILTGKINDVGEYTRQNVRDSYRAGIESELACHLTPRWVLAGNLSISRNRIREFNEYIDDYDQGGQQVNTYRDVPIAFSPEVIAALQLIFKPAKGLSLTAANKYVGQQYLDNTANNDRSLDAFLVTDLRAEYRFSIKSIRDISFRWAVYNLFNREYAPNGYTYSYIYGGQTTTENFYYPQAGINGAIGVSVRF